MAGIKYPIEYDFGNSEKNLRELLKLVKEHDRLIEKAISVIDKWGQEQVKASNESSKAQSDLLKVTKQLEKAQSEEAKQVIAIREQIKALNKQTREAVKLKQAEETINKKQVKSIKDLEERTNALVLKRKNLDLSTKEGIRNYKLLTEEIRRNNAQLLQYDSSIGRSQRNVGNYAQAITGAAGKIALFATAILGAKRALDSTINLLSDTSDLLTDVQKTTGLTSAEVEKLFNDLKQLDTRTSVAGLLQIATAAGRMGIAKDEIVDFTTVVDKAVLALGDSLDGSAEEIALDLAKISSVLGLQDLFGAAGGIERVGSIINELGQNTKATEGNLVDFLKRLQGTAGIANISAADIAGLGASLEEAGLRAEVAATASSKLITAIGKDLPKFANIAGLSFQEFSKIASEDANEALILVLESAKSSKAGLAGLGEVLTTLGVDGDRVAQVVAALTKDINRLRANQELANRAFEENTSLTKEADLRNNNLAASLEKLQNEFEKIVTDPKFIDFIKTLVDLFKQLVPVLTAVIGFFPKLGKGISNLATDIVRADNIISKFFRAVFSDISDVEKQLIKSEEQLRKVREQYGEIGKAVEADSIKKRVRSALDFVVKSYETAKNKLVDIGNQIGNSLRNNLAVDAEKNQIKTIEELIAIRERNNQLIKEGKNELIKLSEFDRQRLALYDKEVQERERINQKIIADQQKRNQELSALQAKLILEEIENAKKAEEQKRAIKEQAIQEQDKILDDILLTELEKFEIEQVQKEAILRSSLRRRLKDEELSSEERKTLAQETEAAILAINQETQERIKQEKINASKEIEEQVLRENQAFLNNLRTTLDITARTIEDFASGNEDALANLGETGKRILIGLAKDFILYAVKQALISKATQVEAIASATATGQAISAAYANAATLASIATFGAATATGVSSVLAGLATVNAASRFEHGGATGHEKNRLIMVNDGAGHKQEYVLPGDATSAFGLHTLNKMRSIKTKKQAQEFLSNPENYKGSNSKPNKTGRYADGGAITTGLPYYGNSQNLLGALNDLKLTSAMAGANTQRAITDLQNHIVGLSDENVAIAARKGNKKLDLRNR